MIKKDSFRNETYKSKAKNLIEYLKRNFAKEIEVRVEFDPDPINPRLFSSNLGKMVCIHKEYILGDVHNLEACFFKWETLESYLRKEENACIILPLFLFDRSGLSISTNLDDFRAVDPFGRYCNQVGFIYTTYEAMRDFFCKRGRRFIYKKKAEEILRKEVKAYDTFLQGRELMFSIISMGEIFFQDGCFFSEDSCWQAIGKELLSLRMELEKEVEGLEKVDVKIRRV